MLPEKYARIERGFSEGKGEETHEATVQRGADHRHPQAAGKRSEDVPFELAAVLPPTDCFLLNSHDCSCGSVSLIQLSTLDGELQLRN